MEQDAMRPVAPDPTTTGASPEQGRSVLQEILDITPREDVPQIQQGLEALLAEVLRSAEKSPKVDRPALDAAIAAIDHKIGAQMDEILHAPTFQQLESTWRGLQYLVNRTDFDSDIRISVMNVSKEDLDQDFADSPDVTFSGLYHHVYTREYGQHGGKPYAAIIADYDFGPSAPDVNLLRSVASVSAMCHAPFIAAAGPEFFGLASYTALPAIKDVVARFEKDTYTAWRGLRESEDSRYLGLTLPRFLLRMPYGPDNRIKLFDYEETVTDDHGHYLWGNTSFAMASRLVDTFAKYGWCPNIIGPQGGGQVEELPVHLFTSLQGDIAAKIPTEILISDTLEPRLADLGFISLSMRKDSDNACFFSANSIQKPKFFGTSDEGKRAELNYKLSTQLPYMFVVSRLAHYIKIIQRENLGTYRERVTLENELNKWLIQYVCPPTSQAAIKARKPFSAASVAVSDVAGDPGWYKVTLQVVPHFKFMGAEFTLSLVGRLENTK